ncbi:MAG: hypothetical protein ACLFV7_02030 [Phycisphaerae bacterium]
MRRSTVRRWSVVALVAAAVVVAVAVVLFSVVRWMKRYDERMKTSWRTGDINDVVCQADPSDLDGGED